MGGGGGELSLQSNIAVFIRTVNFFDSWSIFWEPQTTHRLDPSARPRSPIFLPSTLSKIQGRCYPDTEIDHPQDRCRMGWLFLFFYQLWQLFGFSTLRLTCQSWLKIGSEHTTIYLVWFYFSWVIFAKSFELLTGILNGTIPAFLGKCDLLISLTSVNERRIQAFWVECKGAFCAGSWFFEFKPRYLTELFLEPINFNFIKHISNI